MVFAELAAPAGKLAPQPRRRSASGNRARSGGAGRNRSRSSRPRQSAPAPRRGRSSKSCPPENRTSAFSREYARLVSARSVVTRTTSPAWRSPLSTDLAAGGVRCYNECIVPGGAMNANPYLALGVRPFINCCSVRTMHGGSLMLPQVRDGDRRGLAPVRQPRRADGGGGPAHRRADRRRMGHRHLRQRRRGGARHRRLRRRQRPGEDAAPAVHRRHGQPRHHPGEAALRLRPGGADDRLPDRRDRHPRRSRRGARRAGRAGRAARQAGASDQRAARGDRRGLQAARHPDHGRRRLRAYRAAEPVARRAAPTSSSTAAASSCAGRRPAASCSATSGSSRRPGATARRTRRWAGR